MLTNVSSARRYFSVSLPSERQSFMSIKDENLLDTLYNVRKEERSFETSRRAQTSHVAVKLNTDANIPGSRKTSHHLENTRKGIE